MKKLNNKQSGFTIIEVVLVLAIAGLIFLVVFTALPQLQRSRRDTARRDQVGRILASLTQNSSNNGGSFPSNPTQFVAFAADEQGYFGTCTSEATGNLECDSLSDPSNGQFSVAQTRNTTPNVGQLFYDSGAVCGGTNNGQLINSSGSRKVAVAIGLEQGGSYCQDNT